jgi:endonuclease/exonuclease/phosphatase family metal-dependent hydrolase
MAGLARAQQVVLAIVLAAVAGGGWVALSSRPGLYPTGCPTGCADATRRPGPLRVIDLNMLHGFPAFARLDARIDRIAAEIARLDADVVLLQEVPWTARSGSVADELAARLRMNHLFLRANANRRAILFEEGEAILSRFPLRASRGTELPWGTDFFEHRVALSAVAETPWGPIGLVATHLSGTPSGTSAAQVEALSRFVGDPRVPTIVGGDFNATPASPPIRALATRWTDALAAAEPPDLGPTCCVDDLTAAPGAPLAERIDYLWLAGPAPTLVAAQRILVEPAGSAGHWLRASDHAGLYAELDLAR